MPGTVRGRLGVAAALAALLAVGWWLRASHLGRLGLVADEGNQVLAVQGILKYGIPKVDSGRLYIRGLPFLYAEAAAAGRFGLNELSLRLPSVVFGLLAILLTYWAGLPLVGRRAALLGAAVIALSCWEIELSRYARFYTAFQCTYVLAIGCFARYLLRRDRRWLAAYAAATFLAFWFHELSIMLALVPLVPVLFHTGAKPRAWWMVPGAAGMAGAWFLFSETLGKLTKISGVVLAASAGTHRSSGLLGHLMGELRERMYAPDLDLVAGTAAAHPVRLGLLAALVGAVLCWLAFRVRRDGWQALAVAPILAAAALQQFGLAALFLVVYLVFFARRWSDVATPALRAVYAAVAACLAFWVWTLGEVPHAKALMPTWLIGFPHLYQYFFRWFVVGWPAFLLVYVCASVWMAARVCAQREDAAGALLLGAVWVPVMATSFLENEFYAARYVFHVYPFMVLLVAWIAVRAAARVAAARGAARAAAVAILALAVCGLLEDAHPVAARRIADRTYTTVKDPVRGHLNWNLYAGFHQDQKSPALYVRRHRQAGELLIAIGAPHQVAIYHFYAGPVDYSVEERVKGYQHRQADGTVRDHVTNSRVIQDVGQLRAIIEAAPGGVWLLGDEPLLLPKNVLYSEPMKAYLRTLAERPDMVGEDGQTFAVHVRAGARP